LVNIADRTEFAEVPRDVLQGIDEEITHEAFELLHAEAVAAGDLAPPPNTLFDNLPGAVVRTLFQIAFGLFVGSIAVAITIFFIRTFATIA